MRTIALCIVVGLTSGSIPSLAQDTQHKSDPIAELKRFSLLSKIVSSDQTTRCEALQLVADGTDTGRDIATEICKSLAKYTDKKTEVHCLIALKHWPIALDTANDFRKDPQRFWDKLATAKKLPLSIDDYRIIEPLIDHWMIKKVEAILSATNPKKTPLIRKQTEQHDLAVMITDFENKVDGMAFPETAAFITNKILDKKFNLVDRPLAGWALSSQLKRINLEKHPEKAVKIIESALLSDYESKQMMILVQKLGPKASRLKSLIETNIRTADAETIIEAEKALKSIGKKND